MNWKIKKIADLSNNTVDEAVFLEAIEQMAKTEPALKHLTKEDKLDFSSESFKEMFNEFKRAPKDHAKVNGYRDDNIVKDVCAIQIGDMDDPHAWVSIGHGPVSTLITVADYVTAEIETDKEWEKEFEKSTLFLFK